MSKFEETTEYRNAHAEYVATAAVAERTGDASAKLQADLDWERTSRKMEREFEASEGLAARLKEVHEKIEKDYPMVPKSVIEHITDPEALLKAAEEIQAKFSAGGDWGTPSGAGGSSEPKNNARKEYNDLVDRVNKGDVQANKEFRKQIIAKQVMPFIQRQAQESNK